MPISEDVASHLKATLIAEARAGVSVKTSSKNAPRQIRTDESHAEGAETLGILMEVVPAKTKNPRPQLGAIWGSTRVFE